MVDALIGLSGVRPGAAVLDLCCGPGRHALELADRGYKVTGVDITSRYLEAAAESARAREIQLELVEADARTWRRPGAFDLALNLYTSFGYFDTMEEDMAMLESARLSLAPRGALIVEFDGKETAARDFVAGERFERDGISVATEFSVLGPWERLVSRWIIDDGARRVDRSWARRLYSGTELRDALFAAGFERVEIYGSWGGAPYDDKAETLIAVARS